MTKPIIRLNNEYTNEKKQEKNHQPAPKRKHLGVILVVSILLFSLASVSLVQAYQNLEKQIALEKEAVKKEQQVSSDLSEREQDIQKLKDPEYLQKYARSKGYTSDNEKTFTLPDSSSSSSSGNSGK